MEQNQGLAIHPLNAMIREMEVLLENMKQETQKFVNDDNNAAIARARKASLALRQSAKDFRAKTLEMERLG